MLKLLPITPIANTCAGSYRNRLGVFLVKIFNYEYDQSFSVLSRVTLNGLNIALDGEKCKFLKKNFFFHYLFSKFIAKFFKYNTIAITKENYLHETIACWSIVRLQLQTLSHYLM